jgi:glycosyltransferase involved in cell wall biosynthesis
MNDTIVSVIMISYGHEKYIKQAIEGVLMQKCNFEFELIVADDCSPDNTQSIVEDIIESHSKAHRIKYFRHDFNKGMQPNFIWAHGQSKGKYIALCEGDDFWTDQHKLQKQVDFLEKNKDCSMCFHRTDELLVDNKIQKSINTYNENENRFFDINDLAKGNFIHTPSVVFKNNVFEYPKWFNLLSVGDYPMWMLLASKGKIGYIKDSMAIYRRGDGIWSNGNSKVNLRHWIQMLIFLKSEIEDSDITLLLNEQLESIFISYNHLVLFDNLTILKLSKNVSLFFLVKSILNKLILKISCK